MTEQLDQDCVIASELGYAVAMGAPNTVDASMACPVCHNADADYLAIHEDATTWVECLRCLMVYEVDETDTTGQDYRLAPDFDPDNEREAERVGVERY
jgi:Zn ribbon nucleic-acid-binding protein